MPIENAIDGMVRDTLDALIFDVDLLIQREVVLDIHLHLMAPPGTDLAECAGCVSFPVALAQCRRNLAEQLPEAELVAANSTADAARIVGEQPEPGTAASPRGWPPTSTGSRSWSTTSRTSPTTRPGSCGGPPGVPAPTGHDRTSIVCFQRADRPGSLHGILGQFAARNINLTQLESRPTKRGLGDYCFAIDLAGHLGRRGRRRLPPRPARRARRRQAPRLVPRRRPPRHRPSPAG